MLAQQVETHAVPRDTYSLSANEYGSTITDGPAIVMMHGFPDSKNLYDVLAPLVSQEYRVITFDFLGWGESDKPVDNFYDMSSLRRDIDAVVDHFSLEDVILVAHDSSGQPSIDWALDNRERSSGLVLLNTFYQPSDNLSIPQLLAEFTALNPLREQSIAQADADGATFSNRVDELVRSFTNDDTYDDTFAPIFADQILDTRHAFYELAGIVVEEIGKRGAAIEQLADFDEPVRLIFGGDDPFLIPALGEDIASVLPNSELVIVDGANHYVQIDAADAVSAEIIDFARSIPEPTGVAFWALSLAFIVMKTRSTSGTRSADQ